MQFATAQVAIGGDRNNTVPKRLTAAEIPVLMAIHGAQSVFDIRPDGEDDNASGPGELARLRATYRAKDEDNKPIIDEVYAGRNPALPQSLVDLNLPDELYAAETRVKPTPAKKRAPKKADEPADSADDGVMG